MTDWITGLIEQLGYLGIAALMFLENLFPPIPSEVVMPLAGFTASKGELSLPGVIAAGTAGTLAGALFWYAVARKLCEGRLKDWAGRHGRWLTLAPDDVDRIDRWFAAHCTWAVTLGHLVPGIRTLISLPAGIFGMKLPRFIALTLLGAGVWNAALAGAGHLLGSRYADVGRYLGPASTAIIGAIAAWYLYRVATFSPRR